MDDMRRVGDLAFTDCLFLILPFMAASFLREYFADRSEGLRLSDENMHTIPCGFGPSPRRIEICAGVLKA
jgi:hypothetical protein